MADPAYAQLSTALGFVSDQAYALEYRGAKHGSLKLAAVQASVRALRKELQARARQLAST